MKPEIEIQHVHKSGEALILAGLIYSDEFTAAIDPIWRDEWIGSPEILRAAGWFRKYFREHGRAPGIGHAEDIFMGVLRSDQLGKAEADVLSMILERVHQKYGDGAKFDGAYALTWAREHFRKRELEEHGRAIAGLTERGEIDRAEEVVRDFRPTALGDEPCLSAARIEPRPTLWIWRDVIPRGDVTLVSGRMKQGKSQWTLSVAAVASSGGTFPGSTVPSRARDVIIVSAEDAVDSVIVPRLIANRADLARVRIVDPADEHRPIGDTKEARRRIEEVLDGLPHRGVGALVILDPIAAFMRGRDANNASFVRSAIRPLADVARRRKVGMVVVHHNNKATDGDALDAVGGSGQFTAAARMVHTVRPDPRGGVRRLFLFVAGNLGRGHPGFAFQVVPERIARGIETSQVAWEAEPVNMTADEALAEERRARRRPKQDRAREWLDEQLEDGPVAEGILEKRAAEAGIGWATVRRVKREIGVRSVREGALGSAGRWLWSKRGEPPPLAG